MTTVYERTAVPRPSRGRGRPRPSPAGPLLALLWAGVGAVVALWWYDTRSVVGLAGWLTDAGRIAGLLCGYSCAVLVALMARVPLLERRIGSDRVARWHAMAGRYTVSLLVAHVTLILFGYAAQDGTGIVHETLSVVFDYPDMLKATTGTLILFAVGITSARAARRRISHEFWYYLHLLTYVAVFLTFFHQLALGSDFVADTAAQAAWYVLYLGTAALVVWFRLLVPVRLNLRHKLRVESVYREAPGVFSIVVRGERLDELNAQAGQFFRWRFLSDGMRWTSTPYSLSAPPRPDRMRITVKALGDHSAAVGLLRPGTRVWAEGPYGALTAERHTGRKALLIMRRRRHHTAARPVRDAARRARRRDAALPGEHGRGPRARRRTGGDSAVARGARPVRGQRRRRHASAVHRRVPASLRARSRRARRLSVRSARHGAGPVRGAARGRGPRPPYPPRVVRAVRSPCTP